MVADALIAVIGNKKANYRAEYLHIERPHAI